MSQKINKIVRSSELSDKNSITAALILKKNLKVVKLSGGLGNQLFQYFFASNNFQNSYDFVIFDVSDYFNGLAKRDFVLKELGLDGHYVTCRKSISNHQNVNYVDITILTTLNTASGWINKNLTKNRLVTEKEVCYTSLDQYDLSGNIYLEGYWQSFRYWDIENNFATKIYNALIQKSLPSNQNPASVIRCTRENICAIHLRRGDYDTMFNKQYHGLCDSAYFLQAMQRIGAKQFHVYSDDLLSARKVFGQIENVKIMDGISRNEIDDFKSLMRYSNLIISNSSFSYLAAYFAYASHHAKVVAPYPWYSFANVGPDTPEQWLMLNRATGATLQEDAIKINATRISVVIPVHARHEFLFDAVNSALNQTFKPLEIILSLNGASESVRNEAKKIGEFHNSIRIIETPTASLSLARNLGIKASIGDYIAFLDDDDVWETQKLEVQIAAAINMSADLVATNYYKFDELNNKYYISNLTCNRSDLWKYDLSIANFLSGGSAALVRRDVFNTVGYFDESMPSCEDHDMWRRVAVAGFKIHFIDDCLVGCRMNADNMSSKPHLMLRGELIHLSKILSEEDDYKDSAQKFYERIQCLLNQHFVNTNVTITAPTTANVSSQKPLKSLSIVSLGALDTDRDRFYYLRKIRQIIITENYSASLTNFIFKKQIDKKISLSSCFIQFLKANKILFYLLPIEVVSYFYISLQRKILKQSA